MTTPAEALGKSVQDLIDKMLDDPLCSYTEFGIEIARHVEEEGWTPLPKEDGTYLIFHVPHATDLGVSTPVKFVEDLEEPESFAEEWREIDCIVGLRNFEVSNMGRVRYSKTGKIQEPTLDEKSGRTGVKLTVNGAPIFIDGPSLAHLMWTGSESTE